MYVKQKKLTKISLAGIISFIAAMVVGCAPLQQAPLVYTSSQVIGVKLGIAPTQPESMEAVIGYKDLDAAYAPVAVSNPHLDKAMEQGKKYDKDLYEIKEIYGIYGTQASAAGATQLLTPEESGDMKVYFERFSAKEESVRATDKARAIWVEAQNFSTLSEKLKDEARSGTCKSFSDTVPLKDNYNNFFSCSSADEQSEIVRKYAQLSEIDKTNNELNQEEVSAKSAYEKANDSSQNAITNLALISEKVKGALEKLASIQKRDAISVYGSFDADTAAETAKSQGGTPNEGSNGVSVKVGKVFSTGVAAQNVSEAQKIAASAVVVSACINAIGDQAQKVHPDAGAAEARKQFIQALVPECFKEKQGK